MTRILALVLRLASAPVGVGVGVWTAQLAPSRYQCPPNAFCVAILYFARPTFATWQCVLFGAGAAAVVLFLSFAVERLPTARSFEVA